MVNASSVWSAKVKQFSRETLYDMLSFMNHDFGREELTFLTNEYFGIWGDAGVEEVPHFVPNLPATAAAKAAPSAIMFSGPERAPLIFLTEVLPDPASALLLKITQAMGLRPEQFCLGLISPGSVTERRQPVVSRLRQSGAKLVVALGDLAQSVLEISSLGQFEIRDGYEVLATVAPDFLLLHPEHKRTVWEQMKLVKAKLGAMK